MSHDNVKSSAHHQCPWCSLSVGFTPRLLVHVRYHHTQLTNIRKLLLLNKQVFITVCENLLLYELYYNISILYIFIRCRSKGKRRIIYTTFWNAITLEVVKASLPDIRKVI